jgi:hypothetical protein
MYEDSKQWSQGDWNTFTLIYLERQYFIVKEIDS